MTGASSSPDHVSSFFSQFREFLSGQSKSPTTTPMHRVFAADLEEGMGRLDAIYKSQGGAAVKEILGDPQRADLYGIPANTAKAMSTHFDELSSGNIAPDNMARRIHTAVGEDAKAHAHRFASARAAQAAHAASINAHEVPHAGAAAAAAPQPEHAQPTPQPAHAARAQAAAHDEAAEKKRGRFTISKKNMIRIGVIGGVATIAWNMIFGTDKPSITVPTLPVELRASAMQEPVRNFMTHASAQMMQDLGKKDVREKLGLSEKEGIQIRVATTAPASDELIKAFKQNGAVDVSYPKGKLLEDKAVSIHYQKDRTDLTVGGVTHSMPTTALAQAMLADNPGKALQEQIKKANAAAGRRPGSAPGF